MTTPVYEMIQINRLVEITLVLITVIIFTRSIQTLYEKISFLSFLHKISMVTPIEMKQETVYSGPKGGSFGRENAWFWTDPTRQRWILTRLIQLAVGRVGDGSSNSPNGESWTWLIQIAVRRVGSGSPNSSNSPNGELDWSVQLTVGRVSLG